MKKMNHIEMEKLLEKVVIVVQAARRIAREVEFKVKEKDEFVNVVTCNDINVQRFLCQELKKLLPEAGFYCEEEELQQMEKDYVWVIDPIDGTMNYTRGIQESAISVGLTYKKEPILGVVSNIWRDDLFTAYKGGGARKNGELIRVSDCSFEQGLFCTAMSLYKKELAKVCSDIIYEVYMQCNDVRRFGSCALELCYLAAGQCDLFFEIRVFPWDYVGASVVLKEAGGVLSNYTEGELTVEGTSPLIGANNYTNYKRLYDIVKQHLTEEVLKNI